MKYPGLRQGLLFLALVASFAAAFWVRSQEESALDVASSISGAREPEKVTITASEQAADLPLDRLTRRTPADTDTDPFRPKSWYVPPPAPPPPPPPKPTAPPLPFQYVGKFDHADGSDLVVYLAKGNESFAVKRGEKFDNVYQFDGIERGQIVILYLPMSIKQHLPIGAP
jgi:hypothetical protein